METRKITVFNTMTSSKEEFQSAASTFGEFKNESGVNVTDMKVTVRETRVTLESDDAQLPEGDIVLFLFKQKSKFGSDSEDRRIIKRLRRMEKKIDEILEAIEDTVESDEDVPEIDTELEELRQEAEEIRRELEE